MLLRDRNAVVRFGRGERVVGIACGDSDDDDDALAPKIFLTRQIYVQRVRWPVFARAPVGRATRID